MLDHPCGQDWHVLLLSMYCPASQAAQNVAPLLDAWPDTQLSQEVLPAVAWNVFASHSSQLEASVTPVPEEYFPGGHLLQPDVEFTPFAEEYLPLPQFTHAASTLSRWSAVDELFPCFPAGHSAHAVASLFLLAYFPSEHSVHSV